MIPKDKEPFINKIILSLIRISEEFKSILQSEFPNIYGDIQSASTNPNSECVKKVELELTNNKEKSLNLLNNFISNKENIEKIKNILNINYGTLSPKPYSGKMFIIENIKEKFKEFMEKINKDRAIFSNFSTSISPDNKLHIYFS